MRHRYRYRSTRRAMETIRASIKSLRGLTDDGDAVGGYIQSLGTTCRQLTSLNAEHVLLSYDIWNLAALNPVINTNASHRVEVQAIAIHLLGRTMTLFGTPPFQDLRALVRFSNLHIAHMMDTEEQAKDSLLETISKTLEYLRRLKDAHPNQDVTEESITLYSYATLYPPMPMTSVQALASLSAQISKDPMSWVMTNVNNLCLLWHLS
eukprot:Blabericola_migrator_1__4545@NODE_241_length_10953_cov_78_450211_g199_i1_p7_GENE_NODE_241_length_10953_cov_78_450211_g199_i1NODE_241_length_10953_cov_78_450211_g199_i1_p7_ORF_typecomplete_len208_score24_50PUL/PF08324_11/0_14_NODE_241_length_10953_cov_78_450211_g199_i131993822